MITECNPFNESFGLKSMIPKDFKIVVDALSLFKKTSKTCFAYGYYDSLGDNCFLEGNSWISVLLNNILPIAWSLG